MSTTSTDILPQLDQAVGQLVSFSVFPVALLGANFTAVELVSVTTADSAMSQGYDPAQRHSMVYASIPVQFRPADDYRSYRYLIVADAAGNKQAIGIPWVRGAITIHENTTVRVTLNPAQPEQAAVIRDALLQIKLDNVLIETASTGVSDGNYASLVDKLVTFNTYAQSELGDFNIVTVNAAVIDHSVATLLGFDVADLHAAVYPHIPGDNNVPDDFTAYGYMVVTQPSGAKQIVGIPWINGPISLYGTTVITATIFNTDANKVQGIRETLLSNGVSGFTISVY